MAVGPPQVALYHDCPSAIQSKSATRDPVPSKGTAVDTQESANYVTMLPPPVCRRVSVGRSLPYAEGAGRDACRLLVFPVLLETAIEAFSTVH
jgi:hypothetical protein